ncbi:MAG: hypothetical protein HGA19_14865, partial [Oscillochloris sp.]|nr:hypothetical protein [Oscillochloris sp.]
MAYKHEDRSNGQVIRSLDWNAMGHEIERLEADKLNRIGDTIKGDLNTTGKFAAVDGRFTGALSVTGKFTGTEGRFESSLSVGGGLRVSGDLIASKYVVQDSVDGGTTRGIWMWNASDTAWGIYMGTAGAGKSLAGGAAVAGNGFSSHAIRLRTGRSADQGLIIENSNEQLNFSVRASDGYAYIRGGLTVDGSLLANKYVVQDSVDGGTTRGIWMWNASDTAWGIYMG